MNIIKKYWKEILIALLAVLFLSKCASSGNYERKYNKEIARVEFVTDSLMTEYAASAKTIDSLRNVISIKDIAINNLNKELAIYKEQNEKLNEANHKLASKQVIVKVNKED